MAEREQLPSPRDPLRLVGSIFERKYRVDRFVAEGGFGLVYAGLHLPLGAPVALKVLRPALRAARDDWADLIHQFREEAIALTRLRRSSVVGVLDSGIAHLDDEPSVPWMALEWLDGETLRDHLAARQNRGGRSPAECLALLRPALEAIADAHDIGIAHRDLKPSNIMLVPTAQGLLPRVLDLGIAKMMAPDGETAAPSGDTATDSQTRAFTATCAAPEQLSGARTGPWTDVYALGLLLTEVLTDRPPVTSTDTNERYRDAFAPTRPTPAQLGVDVGPWEPILTRALAVRPADRQKNARELLEQLDRALRAAPELVTGSPTTAPARASRSSMPPIAATGDPTRRDRRWKALRRGAIGIGVAAALAAIGMEGARTWRAGHELPSLAPTARPLVLVSPLHLDAADASSRVAVTFAELLSEQLRIGDAMRVPAPDARDAILQASGVDTKETALAPSALARMHQAAGADVVVGAATTIQGATLTADLTLYDAAGGAVLGRLSLHGAADDVNALVREAGARVRRGLGRPALSLEDEAALRTSLPENAGASVAYVEGLAARRAFRHREAATHFEEAVRLAPAFAPAHAALAQVLLRLGEQTRAREIAARAVQLAASLPRAEELAVSALAAETRNDWSAAAESYRALAQFYPDRIDHVTSLARALVGTGHAGDAIAVLESAKQRPHSDWDLLRIDLVEAFAHSRRAEDPAALADAREAEQIAARIGARVPGAEAVMSQAHTERRAGHLDEAEALFARARAVYAEVDDAEDVLHCDAGSEEIAAMRGDFDRAIALGERMVAAHHASGNVYRAARETVSLGLTHAAAGHLAQARALCDEGGQLFEQAHDREGEAFRVLNLAQLDLTLGRLDGVADRAARGRAMHLSIGQRAGVAMADEVLALLAAAEGRTADAEAAFELAYADAVSAGDAGLLADVALERARFAFDAASAEERSRFDDASKAVAASSDVRLAALLDVHAARRANVAGRAPEARTLARRAEDRARASHAPDAIALALATVLDTFPAGETATPDTPSLREDEREARRAELASRADALEAVVPAIAATLALSRAARDGESAKLADHAVSVAAAHGLVVQELAARAAAGRARGASGARDAAAAERALAKRGLPNAARVTPKSP